MASSTCSFFSFLNWGTHGWGHSWNGHEDFCRSVSVSERWFHRLFDVRRDETGCPYIWLWDSVPERCKAWIHSHSVRYPRARHHAAVLCSTLGNAEIYKASQGSAFVCLVPTEAFCFHTVESTVSGSYSLGFDETDHYVVPEIQVSNRRSYQWEAADLCAFNCTVDLYHSLRRLFLSGHNNSQQSSGLSCQGIDAVAESCIRPNVSVAFGWPTHYHVWIWQCAARWSQLGALSLPSFRSVIFCYVAAHVERRVVFHWLNLLSLMSKLWNILWRTLPISTLDQLL